MKKILLFIFLTGTASMGFAQDSSRTKLKSKQAADLKLDDKQNKELQQINRSYMQNAKDIRENGKLGKEDKEKQLEALNTERTGKIQSVLSPDQFSKWQENREKTMARAEAYKEKRHKKDGRDGKRKRTDNSEEAVKALGLTDAQGQELRTINKDFVAKASGLRSNTDLSKEQRHEQMKSLNAERLEKIKLALGNDRYMKYDEWRRKEKDRYKSMRKRDSIQMKMKKKDASENL